VTLPLPENIFDSFLPRLLNFFLAWSFKYMTVPTKHQWLDSCQSFRTAKVLMQVEKR